MPEEQTPEMLRLSLQDLVLRVKICKLGGIEKTLSEALDPPSSRNIQRAIDSLVDVKALTAMEDLTPLGRQLARLPLDVFLGKLILLGTIFRCLDAMLTIAALLSSKSPFSAPMGARAQADLARLAFKKGRPFLPCPSFGYSDYVFQATLTYSLYTTLTMRGVESAPQPGWECPSSNFAAKIS